MAKSEEILSEKDWQALRARLRKSKARSVFQLGEAERAYVSDRGMELIEQHARDFVRQRLAPAEPRNEGRQTPTRGHPVFIAQHATGTDCRASLEQWHGIPMKTALSGKQVSAIVQILLRWIRESLAES